MAITFEDGVESIPATEESLSYPWVEGKDSLTGLIDDTKQDNFGSGTVSITEGINILNEVDAKLEESNYYYEVFPEKKTLMNEILDLMDKFKEQKTSLDPEVLGNAVSQYNNNLELAQKTYSNAKLRDTCRRYNNSGDNRLRLNIRACNREKNSSREIVLGKWDGDKWVNTGNRKTEKEVYLNDTITYDTIKSDGLSSAPSSIEGLTKTNESLAKELSKRGISFDPIPERPAGAK